MVIFPLRKGQNFFAEGTKFVCMQTKLKYILLLSVKFNFYFLSPAAGLNAPYLECRHFY